MKKYSAEELTALTQKLREKEPKEIVQWALAHGQNPLVTTNFRPYETAILHAVSEVEPTTKIIWCDTGYNTTSTYLHAREVIDQLHLNVKLYTPRQTAAYRNAVFGGIPKVDTAEHKEFTKQVKLEPFQRAMQQQQPDVWFTNLRKGQTAFRNSIDILSYGENGVLKVSPFYHWNDQELDDYLEKHDLPNEFDYYDPTKVLANRECGLHA